jgi:hypothetical protein
MHKINLNKKSVNNLILGSSLCGISASIITIAQATQQVPLFYQMADVLMKKNIVQLGDLLFREEIPVDQCEKLIAEKRINLNIPVGPLCLLEKAILYGKSKAVQFLLKQDGINIAQKDKDNNSLLHMAMWDHEMDGWKVEQSNIETAIKNAIAMLEHETRSDQQVKDESSDVSSCASLEVVQLLLKAGLKANEKNN